MSTDEPTTSENTSAQDGAADGPAAAVQLFVRLLAQRYRALREAGATTLPDVAAADQRLSELLLGEAALRFARPAGDTRAGGDGSATRPPQLAVLGPTQTGKSTIVNLIVDAPAAEVSPLAGFTVHPQGFWIGVADEDERWTAVLFPGWQRCAAEQLSREELESYALTRLDEARPPPAGLPPCVIWDTPDFDTLAAHSYRRGVLEVAALADVHVFVLSKEKYSDLSVWQLLRLLQPLNRPLVICLNKLSPDAVETVSASLGQRLAELGGPNATAPIIPFEYQPGLDAPTSLAPLPEVWELRDHITARLKAAPSVPRAAGVQRFVRAHWSDWTAPIEVELAAVRAWHEQVEAALGTALESYRRDFLDHPQRFDTFRRATVELLHLLELPGFANVVSQVRHVLSWPMRRLLVAKQAWAARRRKQAGLPHGPGSEEVVLYEIIEKLLTGLERDAARRCDPSNPGHAVWHALVARLERHSDRLRRTFQAAAEMQREEFAPQIQAAANRLYEALQEKPVVLNSLRVARATTDVASIALAIKAGGLNINDLLFAPAMFALASMLAEGALGTYMSHIANDLKKQQFEHVRKKLVEGVLTKELRELAADLKDAGLFGVSAQRLHAATQVLQAWEQSDDE